MRQFCIFFVHCVSVFCIVNTYSVKKAILFYVATTTVLLHDCIQNMTHFFESHYSITGLTLRYGCLGKSTHHPLFSVLLQNILAFFLFPPPKYFIVFCLGIRI